MPCALVEGVTADQGHAAGYEAGYAEGQRDAEAAASEAERENVARIENAVSALRRSVDAAQSAYQGRSAELESAVPRFAFDLLEVLFGRESVLAVDPGREAVARALALEESTLPAVARLSPDDADTIGELADLWPSGPLTVVADPTVEPGGALVEVGSTTIDSQLSRALERVRAVIVGQPEEVRSVSTVLDELCEPARAAARPRRYGRVDQVVGMSIEISGVPAAVGDGLLLLPDDGPLQAEVVALRDGKSVCVALGETTGLRAGTPATAIGRPLSILVGESLLGRVLDGLGRPIDGGPPLRGLEVSVDGRPPHPLRRGLVDEQLPLGVRVLDGLIPCGKGQRLGIFAGSGVGKSSLLSMIARGTEAKVSVVALIGERGREVAEFIERDLGPEGMARSVVVVATSDAPAMVRIRAAFTATRIAEWFRDRGDDVVLMMDSVTRFAMAQREVGLAAGEPPATRGYPPSVFGLLPRLLERGGRAERGSITGLYTVLVEGDDINEPIADTTRSILDGHIRLSRSLAEGNHYPAVDVLESISRVAPAIAPDRGAPGRCTGARAAGGVARRP